MPVVNFYNGFKRVFRFEEVTELASVLVLLGKISHEASATRFVYYSHVNSLAAKLTFPTTTRPCASMPIQHSENQGLVLYVKRT